MEPLDPDVVLDDDEITGNPKYAVPGYKAIPLLSALNGYQLESSENGSAADPSEESGNHEQHEGDKSPAEGHSPRGQATSQFCAIPIEDLEDEDNEIATESVPVPPPRSPTAHSQPSRVKQYEDTGPLPGTLISEDDDDVSFRTKTTASYSSSNQLTTSVIITDDGEEGQEVASLELHPPHSDPDSPYASSVSSQQSVKSTDMLLPGQTSQGGGGKAPGEAGRRTK